MLIYTTQVGDEQSERNVGYIILLLLYMYNIGVECHYKINFAVGNDV